mmetsp:Transcript_839/g.2545  ORF Transcript_839/g.2545 Transcript_839/m.2545 type:complete len:262 (-) Transcript_839:1737-2522(-)
MRKRLDSFTSGSSSYSYTPKQSFMLSEVRQACVKKPVPGLAGTPSTTSMGGTALGLTSNAKAASRLKSRPSARNSPAEKSGVSLGPLSGSPSPFASPQTPAHTMPMCSASLLTTYRKYTRSMLKPGHAAASVDSSSSRRTVRVKHGSPDASAPPAPGLPKSSSALPVRQARATVGNGVGSGVGGKGVGFAVGWVVGWRVGCTVGARVGGGVVGFCVGTGVGMTVGRAVGCGVGHGWALHDSCSHCSKSMGQVPPLTAGRST